SGSSQNVIEAVTTGREKGLLTVAFTGEGGGKMAALPHYILDVPSTSTPRIQEVHLFLLHLLAQELEERLS
ncbi:MAG: phosphoheptose isomerase, partial [Candidatus Aminicenantes bacterium]